MISRRVGDAAAVIILIAAATLVWAGQDGGQNAGNFRDEMARKSSQSGLAIGDIGGSVMRILPLEGGYQWDLTHRNYLDKNLGPCGVCPGWFSQDGRLIVWEVWPYSILKPEEPSILVQTIAGQTIATWVGLINSTSALALSPDKSRVALEVFNHETSMPVTGLQYVVLGTSKRVFLEPQPPEKEPLGSRSIGWSPDSRRIVYSRHSRVLTVDIETAKREEIAEGNNPAWSPDGRWISYATLDKRPMLMDPSTGRVIKLWAGRQITGPIAWAPDSCCISFSSDANDIKDAWDRVVYPGGNLIVYRISDGSWFKLSGFFASGPQTSAGFGWFYGYKDFLARNEANGRAPRK